MAQVYCRSMPGLSEVCRRSMAAPAWAPARVGAAEQARCVTSEYRAEGDSEECVKALRCPGQRAGMPVERVDRESQPGQANALVAGSRGRCACLARFHRPGHPRL